MKKKGNKAANSTPDPSDLAVRADRWLWAARFYKSRSLAAEACGGGEG